MSAEWYNTLQQTSTIDSAWRSTEGLATVNTIIMGGTHPSERYAMRHASKLAGSWSYHQKRADGIMVVLEANRAAARSYFGPQRSVGPEQLMAYYDLGKPVAPGRHRLRSLQDYVAAQNLSRLFREADPSLILDLHDNESGMTHTVLGKSPTPVALGAAVMLGEELADLGFRDVIVSGSPFQRLVPQGIVVEQAPPPDGKSRNEVDERIDDCLRYIVELGPRKVSEYAEQAHRLTFFKNVGVVTLADPITGRIDPDVVRVFEEFMNIDEPTSGDYGLWFDRQGSTIDVPNAQLRTPAVFGSRVLEQFNLPANQPYYLMAKYNQSSGLTPDMVQELAQLDPSLTQYSGIAELTQCLGAIVTRCEPPNSLLGFH